MLSSLAFAASLLAVVAAAPQHLKRQAPPGVPDYVLKHAPLVYLHSKEKYFPSDIQAQLTNSIPRIKFNPVTNGPSPLDLNNLNSLDGASWLTSKDDITKNPTWIQGVKPDSTGKINDAVTAAVIVNDKGNGNVDAFYMYFYAYNWGGKVLKWDKLQFGNHVGDWEHNMIRFRNGVPTEIWYSQHANGQAFKFPVVQKHSDGARPYVYSSEGSHANYAIPGTHDHTIPNLNLPGGVLEDYTDKGYLWDPLLSAYYYSFDAGSEKFKVYGDEATTPVDWLYWRGRWGDEEYPTSDRRQVKAFGQAKYSGGPTGPIDKQLNREKICPNNGKTCILRNILVPKSVEMED